MIEKKFNWKIWFFIVLFGVVLLLMTRVIYMIITDQVVDENGQPLPRILEWILCGMFALVGSTYAVTFITLVKQVVAHQNVAFTVDRTGIHNTLVFVYLFAFVIVVPVKLIPWSAVHYVDRKDDGIYIRVKRKQVTASGIGRLIIGILGYHFCYSFTKGPLSETEIATIAAYCTERSHYLNHIVV